jgi:hypothetical protein
VEEYSLAITILCNGTVHTQTVSSLLETFNSLPIRKHVGFIIGGYPAYSRNMAVENARELKVSHLMFIDGDQTFPGDGVKRLLEHKKDIVGANYNERRFPLRSTVKLMNEQGEMIGGVPIPDTLFKAYGLGMGFCLIDMKIFDKMQAPWFDTEVWVNPEGKAELKKTEDIFFCEKARAAGIDVWCDPLLQIGHIGQYVY